MSRIIIEAILYNLLIFSLFSAEIKIGDVSPFFAVKSGDGKYLTLDDLKGKIVIMFYETRDAVDENKELKKELNGFYDAQSGDIKQKVVKVAIIDCSEAYWPFTIIWKKKLIGCSREKSLTIYGDWDGEMKKAYGFHSGKSNFVILDKAGRVKFFQVEKIARNQFQNIKKFISELVLLS